jgi:hypothetical protein
MRYVLGLGLLIAAMVSADAATVRHSLARHVVLPAGVASSFAAVPTAAYAVPRYDDTPSYNDPSKFGGQTPY